MKVFTVGLNSYSHAQTELIECFNFICSSLKLELEVPNRKLYVPRLNIFVISSYVLFVTFSLVAHSVAHS